MFVSVRDQGRRRRSQTYGVSKAARSSKLSLLSAITTGSHGSNDSASTITPESYTRSSSGSGKKRKASKPKRTREGRGETSSSRKSGLAKAQKQKSMSTESVDVFAFLVQDDKAGTKPQQSQEATHLEQGSRPGLEESDNESMVRSVHSDSGISMGDNSIYHPNSEPPLETHLPPLSEDTHETDDIQAQVRSRPLRSGPIRWKWPEIPPATTRSNSYKPQSRPPSPERQRIRFLHPSNQSDKASWNPKKALSGYDLVADRLSHGEVPPVFRRFSKIHFRVLLQMQDEIGEMEEELAALDLADKESRLNPDGSTTPASRRINWQWSLSDLQARRLEVLGRLYIKLEQYYQAMTSGQKVQRLSTQVELADVEGFRAWLHEHHPLSIPESRFLDTDDDLISLKEASAPLRKKGATPDLLPLCIVTMALFPLLCFKFLTGVLNRLILLTALLAAGLNTLERLDRGEFEQYQQWLVACFGVSLVAALFF